MILLTTEQKDILEHFVHCRNSPQWLAKRSQAILHLANGLSIQHTARQLQMTPKTIRRWKQRWEAKSPALVETKDVTEWDKPLDEQIASLLRDAPRDGRPLVFRPEEVVQIVVLACEEPQQYHRPVSHWTAQELADEAIKQGIVSRISARTVGRFLKGVESQASPKPILAQSRH